jgi:hypothetical protein
MSKIKMMHPTNKFCRDFFLYMIGSLIGLAILVTSFPKAAGSQEEATSVINRYKGYEVSSGYYEEYEVKPLEKRPLVGVPGVARGLFPYSPTGAPVRIRTRLADSHRGIKFYGNLKCKDCHPRETRDIHTVRANLTCRQCHGNEPIASIQHYYSPMNPIRRHAYICSKCHEGASASFASYVIHAPNPAIFNTMESFPMLFYVFWFMMILAVGTFAAFLPHTVAWGIRELLSMKEMAKSEPKTKE